MRLRAVPTTPSLARAAAITAATLLAACLASSGARLDEPDRATIDGVPIPRLWDERELAGWATPVAGLGVAPGHCSEAEYYAAPVDNVRTYPVYHPSREPPGYRAWLRSQGSQRLIEPEKLRTRAEWLAAGRRVFLELDTAILRCDDPAVIAFFGDAAAIDATRDAVHDAIDRDGVLLDYRWVVRADGSLAVGVPSCVGCHSRLMPDGSVLLGAPTNFDLADTPAARAILSKLLPDPPPPRGESFWQQYGVPWRADDPHARFRSMSDEELGRFFDEDSGAPPGTTFDRFGGSPLFTTRMADLIGVGERRWLDATGTHSNRGPADVARYGILVEFADCGAFGPHRFAPELNQRLPCRPPDEAMFALALFVESLEHPRSPQPFDERARRGRELFESEGCAECHPPPLFTSNELLAVEEFDPPMDDEGTRRLPISTWRIDTDPGLALKTRKGTGYYKVPSLRGLWYRGLYEHSGSIATLEEWFDPRRLRDDYVPSGFRGRGVAARAVPGHRFGLDLADADKQALIAFLRSL
jgi:hypothetical protein